MIEQFVPYEKVATWVSAHQKQRGKVVFVTGCFDILHIGHVEFLKQAKALGDVLLVGLESDATVQKTKGVERPVYSERDRLAVLSAVRFVDGITILPDLHWERLGNSRVLEDVRPDFLALSEGDPYFDKKRQAANALGIKCSVVVGQIHNSSTSRIIELLSKEN